METRYQARILPLNANHKIFVDVFDQAENCMGIYDVVDKIWVVFDPKTKNFIPDPRVTPSQHQS